MGSFPVEAGNVLDKKIKAPTHIPLYSVVVD
jgi:hypothetical protein